MSDATDPAWEAAEGGLRDYVAWHGEYDDPTSALSARLRVVQAEIAAYLDHSAPDAVQVVSVCAGEGRDILGVLAGRDDTERVSGALIEIDPRICAVAQAEVDRLGLGSRLLVRQADAGRLPAYDGLRPADLLLLSGIMGNISPEDIRRLIHVSRRWCAPGATVIWTRGAQEPDLGAAIRGWFEEAGYDHVALHEEVEGTSMRVGVERLVRAEPVGIPTGAHAEATADVALREDPALLPQGDVIFTFFR